MAWYIWVIIIDIAISALNKVATVGRYREPITPAYAVIAVVVSALYIWAIVYAVTT